MDSSPPAHQTGPSSHHRDGHTTADLVNRLRRLELSASAAGLHADVHRGLISPLMPDEKTPGRGVPARWSAMSVHRARRIARLRQRGVNGHVLPLLLFLDDGWGWARILPALIDAARTSWTLDRAYINQPTRVRTAINLLENAGRGDAWHALPDPGAFLAFRRWLFSMAWSGEPVAGATMVPLMASLLPEMLGKELTGEQLAAVEVFARQAEQRRIDLHLSAADLPAWLAALEPADVDRGRVLFRTWLRLIRQLNRRQNPNGGGANPLTLGGFSKTEIADYLRGAHGRVTAAQMLGGFIAQAMVAAKQMEGLPVTFER